MLVTLVLSATFMTASTFLGVSPWPCPRWADSRCVSCALLHFLVPLRISWSSVLSVASCTVTSLRVSCVGILLRSHGLSIPPKGMTPEIVRSSSLRLMSRRSWPALMLSRHHSLCSLTSALICAVLHTSLESPLAGCTREYASCAFRRFS